MLITEGEYPTRPAVITLERAGAVSPRAGREDHQQPNIRALKGSPMSISTDAGPYDPAPVDALLNNTLLNNTLLNDALPNDGRVR